jgi:hypothetical protein
LFSFLCFAMNFCLVWLFWRVFDDQLFTDYGFMR